MDLNDPDQIKDLIAHLELEADQDKLSGYKPYDKQLQFHNAGAKHRERLLMAGNQLGKTLAGSMEVAMHACGTYPNWWQGKRFDKPTVSWVPAAFRQWAAGASSPRARTSCLSSRLRFRVTGCDSAAATLAGLILRHS